MAAGSVAGVPSRHPSLSSLLVMVSCAAAEVRDKGQRGHKRSETRGSAGTPLPWPLGTRPTEGQPAEGQSPRPS